MSETHRNSAILCGFADHRAAPHAAAADRDSAYPQASFDACTVELPALGVLVESGGSGADMITRPRNRGYQRLIDAGRDC